MVLIRNFHPHSLSFRSNVNRIKPETSDDVVLVRNVTQYIVDIVCTIVNLQVNGYSSKIGFVSFCDIILRKKYTFINIFIRKWGTMWSSNTLKLPKRPEY